MPRLAPAAIGSGFTIVSVSGKKIREKEKSILFSLLENRKTSIVDQIG